MIPHILTLFEFIIIPYENQHQRQTLNIKKIDRGQIKCQEYSITLLQPKVKTKSDIQGHGHVCNSPALLYFLSGNHKKCPIVRQVWRILTAVDVFGHPDQKSGLAQPLKILVANGVGSQKQVKIWSLDNYVHSLSKYIYQNNWSNIKQQLTNNDLRVCLSKNHFCTEYPSI